MSTKTAHSWTPTPNKGETDYGIVDAMRDRIYDPVGTGGQPITITVSAPMPAAQGKNFGGRKLIGAGGAEYRLDSRTIQGHRAWTDRPAARGTVMVDEALGVEVKWTLLPFSVDPQERRLPFGGKGHIIARYKNESMVLAAPGSDYPDLPAKMRLFGVHLARRLQPARPGDRGTNGPRGRSRQPAAAPPPRPDPVQACPEQRRGAAPGPVGRAVHRANAPTDRRGHQGRPGTHQQRQQDQPDHRRPAQGPPASPGSRR